VLAILYLFVMFALGDAIGRRFFAFVSVPHRLASAFLCGLLFSSWWTYILAYMFSNTTVPMVLGNIAFFFTAIGATGLTGPISTVCSQPSLARSSCFGSTTHAAVRFDLET